MDVNRRKLMQGAMAAPAVATLKGDPHAAAYPRVAWIALCRPVDREDSSIPGFAGYAESQRRHGRRVVHVVERAMEDTLVVVEHRCTTEREATEFLERFNRMCFGEDSSAYEEEFGHVWAITSVSAGQVLDPLRLVALKDTERVDALGRQVSQLRQEVRAAEEACKRPVEDATTGNDME